MRRVSAVALCLAAAGSQQPVRALFVRILPDIAIWGPKLGASEGAPSRSRDQTALT
jgi:hypothetical protein